MRFLKAILNKPWDHQGEAASAIAGDMMSVSTSPQQLALNLFPAVASVLFALFGVAYFMRMEVDTSSPFFCGAGYWEVLQEPDLLWLNTGILVLTSGVIEFTKRESRANRSLATKIGLSVGALLTLAFLYGQSAAWGILHENGHLVDSTAASSFFYLLTGLHALHLIGGCGFGFLPRCLRSWIVMNRTRSARLSGSVQSIGTTCCFCGWGCSLCF